MSGQESARPLKGMFYPSSTGTLTSVKMIEMIVESACATERVQSAIASCFLLFYGNPLNFAHRLFLNVCNHCGAYQKSMYE
jgi:hypothetical protein